MSEQPTRLHRRDFLSQLGVLAAGAGAVSAIGASSAEALLQGGGATPKFRISLAEWSFHRGLRGQQGPKLDHLDFARMAKRDYGIEAVEYVNGFFKDKAKDKAYLTEMKTRAEGEGVRSLLIMIDDEGRLGDVDAAKRAEAVDKHKPWAEAAKFLGCHSIRVNAYSEGTEAEQRDRVAEGLRKLTEFAAPMDLNIIVENHGRLSSNGEWLVSVMKQVNHPRCGTLPDFGNFDLGNGQMYDRYKGVAEMMPFAKAVSAKSHDFDEKGNEIHTDYFKMVKIVLDAGYHGHLGIEYEGEKISEAEGVRATKTLLERVRDAS